jgi:hypothetical protein
VGLTSKFSRISYILRNEVGSDRFRSVLVTVLVALTPRRQGKARLCRDAIIEAGK